MPSELYKKLYDTAKELINSMDQDVNGNFDEARILAVRTEDYKQQYGHTYMVEKARPGQYHSMDNMTLMEHLRAAGPAFESMPHEFKSILVDEEQRQVAVRWEIKIKVKGVAEIFDYDICWLVAMNDEGTKAKEATEFVDGYVSDKIAELLKEAEKSSGAPGAAWR